MTLWLIGGLDPTGGAGVLRDWATAQTLAPAFPTRTVVTVLTQQGQAPAVSQALAVENLRFQLATGPVPSAIKLGVVPDTLVAVLEAFVRSHRVPVVVDPVLNASDGGALGATPDALLELLRAATLVTPNLDELQCFGGDAAALANSLGAAVLVKGGHATEQGQVRDTLWSRGVAQIFERERWPGPDPRGTGCALATAIALNMAQGVALVPAVQAAIGWLDHARRRVEQVAGQVQLRK